MDSTPSGVQGTHKPDDEKGRHAKRLKLKHLNTTPIVQGRLLSETFHCRALTEIHVNRNGQT